MRFVSGMLAGFVVWWAAFYAIGGIILLIIPGFPEAGRIAVDENDWSHFTTVMLLPLIAMYFVINPLAGWLTVFISKNRHLVWATMAPLFLYAAHSHLIRLWDNLPNWYNVAVVVLIPPLMYLGSRLAKLEPSAEQT
ncbi:MAG: hypothetical protein GKR91_05200 [Pseudomonadales bacterium]|nr:hypothetical protein [Pseudomonadales bacterium]